MRFRRPNPELLANRCLRLVVAGMLFVAHSVWSETIILHLKNGDSVKGFVLSTTTNHIVLSNSWSKELIVPLAEIAKREAVVITNVPVVTPPGAPAVAAAPPTNAPTVAAVPSTNAPVAAKPQSASTNAPAPTPTPPKPTSPPAVAATPPAPAPKPAKPKVKHWKANAQVGFDLAYGARDRQNYFGLVKLTYERPYESNPKKFFRNIFETRMDYGKTEDVLSANKLDTSNKTDADIGNKLFVYNLVRIGYDEIRKIDLYYEAGPGIGYHLVTATNFVMNTELGLTYQAQEREAPSDDTENVYFRLAEDFTWKINKTVTLIEKLEVFPQVDFSDFRVRFESTLSFPLWKTLSFNITVLDLYDSDPAQNVDNNELQIRSSVGITF